jgi:hypothetical protein
MSLFTTALGLCGGVLRSGRSSEGPLHTVLLAGPQFQWRPAADLVGAWDACCCLMCRIGSDRI